MDTNVTNFSVTKGGKDGQELPFNTYAIEDKTGREFVYEGFLLFTSHHVAVMQERGPTAIPVFLMPIAELAFVEIVDPE